MGWQLAAGLATVDLKGEGSRHNVAFIRQSRRGINYAAISAPVVHIVPACRCGMPVSPDARVDEVDDPIVDVVRNIRLATYSSTAGRN